MEVKLVYDHALSARRADYTVRSISIKDARELVIKYHYAKGGSNTGCYAHGLHRASDDKLVGVAWWLPPTKVACQSVDMENWKQVLSLTRLVVAPEEPKNAATILLGASIKLIKLDGRFTSLVTYADDSQGHTGAIYRATNWEYCGVTKPRTRWVDPLTGQQVASKATVNRTKSEMIARGCIQTAKSFMHKFIMRLPPRAVKKFHAPLLQPVYQQMSLFDM